LQRWQDFSVLLSFFFRLESIFLLLLLPSCQFPSTQAAYGKEENKVSTVKCEAQMAPIYEQHYNIVVVVVLLEQELCMRA